MRRLALALLGLAALGLSACGGDEGGGGDEAEIRAVIEASGMSEDPADCRRYKTRNMMEQGSKLRGEAALRACEEVALEDRERPTAVTVTRIEVDGDRATAQATYVDGPFSEQVPVLALVEVDGEWKEDEVLEFAEFDPEAFVLEFGRELMGKAGTPAEVDLFSCMVGELEGRSDQELEALLIDPSPQPLLDLVLACEPSSASA